ncbi:hypothetical protein ABTD52_18230, partial [Acinetobacter baumannii]
NKTGGQAIGGALIVGGTDANLGYAGSRVVRWLQSNQVPDFLAPVTVQSTGLLDLNGNSETLGNVDAQTGLTINAGVVSL